MEVGQDVERYVFIPTSVVVALKIYWLYTLLRGVAHHNSKEYTREIVPFERLESEDFVAYVRFRSNEPVRFSVHTCRTGPRSAACPRTVRVRSVRSEGALMRKFE
jgi:hypothetical protein